MRGMKTLLLASAAAMIATGAYADEQRKVVKVVNTLDKIYLEEDFDRIVIDVVDTIDTKFQVDQLNRGAVSAHAGTWVSNVTDYSATAAAIANNASVDVKGNAGGDNWQGNWGDTTATLNTDIQGAWGKTELTAVAIGNNFNLNVQDYGGAVFSSRQVNDGAISAHLNANVTGEINDVSTTAVAIGNNLAVQTAGSTLIGGVEQVNNGDVTATNNTVLRPVQRAVDPAIAAAIGNNISITNYIPKVQ